MFTGDPNLACPFCHKKLIKGEQKRYETLCEHVSDPNIGEYPLRDTWVCDCEKAKDSFWDWFGDFYTRSVTNIGTGDHSAIKIRPKKSLG